MAMTFDKRLTIALAILARTGIRPIWYAPPTHRLLWRLGARLRPPHFSSQAANFLWLSLVVTLPALALSLVRGHGLAGSLWDNAVVIFCTMSFVSGYKRSAEMHGLPSWEEVEAPDQPFRAPSPPSRWLRD